MEYRFVDELRGRLRSKSVSDDANTDNYCIYTVLFNREFNQNYAIFKCGLIPAH